VRESGSSGGVSESFFVSGGFSVNRWKFRGESEVSPKIFFASQTLKTILKSQLLVFQLNFQIEPPLLTHFSKKVTKLF
jgi:hypothetical protein